MPERAFFYYSDKGCSSMIFSFRTFLPRNALVFNNVSWWAREDSVTDIRLLANSSTPARHRRASAFLVLNYLRNQNHPTCWKILIGGRERTRTSTDFTPLVPKTSVYTNFTTRPNRKIVSCLIVKF